MITDREIADAELYIEALLPGPTAEDRPMGRFGIGSAKPTRYGRLIVFYWHSYEIMWRLQNTFHEVPCWRFLRAEVAE